MAREKKFDRDVRERGLHVYEALVLMTVHVGVDPGMEHHVALAIRDVLQNKLERYCGLRLIDVEVDDVMEAPHSHS